MADRIMAAGNNKKMDIKKKILFLVTQSEFGGAQHFIHTLATNLSQDKYSITVAAGLDGDNENGLLFALEKKGINTRHLRYLRRSINPFFDCLGFFEIKKLIKIEKPDILFLCSSKAGFLGSLAGKSAKLPKVIYRIGGWTFNDPWPNWKRKLYIWLEKSSAKWKDYIINNAESDKQQAIKLGIKPKKGILTIYNGIDADKLEFLNKKDARKEIFRRSTQIKSQQVENTQINAENQRVSAIVGTIANDYPTKGLKYLREIEGKLQDIKLVILSNIPDAYKYLKAFDIFVLSSVKEGFPWVVLEAMAAEVPIIATKVGAVPEIIQNNENGILIEPKSPKAIIDAVKLLMDNKDLMRKLAINGRKTVIEKFNLEKMINRYVELFESTN